MSNAVWHAGLGRREQRVVRVFRFVRDTIWRAALCLVIVPGALAASIWALLVAFGVTTTQDAVQAIYDGFDGTLRNAPAGMVHQDTCIEHFPKRNVTPQVDKYKDLRDELSCKTMGTVDVPVASVVAETAASLKKFYWALVAVSTFFVFARALAQGAVDLIFYINYVAHRLIARAKYVLGGRNGIPPL